MSHFQLFIDSLTNPKKLASYRVLSVGKVLQYTFLLITVMTVFSFGQFIGNVTANFEQSPDFLVHIENNKWIIYPFGFLLLFITMTSIQFLKISVYAFVGLLLLKAMQRRGEYRHIWRTATFAITWATIITLVFTTLQLPDVIATVLGLFITMLIIIIALSHYPKLPPTTR